MAQKKQPIWVDSPPVASDKVYAVGSANIGPNPVNARKKAEDDARQELGKSISIKVKSVMEKFTQEAIDLINTENASSIEITTEVSSSVTDATVTGSQIIERWEDKENKVYYALAVMDKTQIVKEIKTVMNDDTKKVFKEEKKEEGTKKLDDELEKWDLSEK
jgi:hypothetical protein